MASQIIRPNLSTGKTAWTAVPVGPNWSVVDDVITQPTVPTTGTDCVQATGFKGDTYEFDAYSLSGSETCTDCTLWFYYKAGSASGMTVTLTGPSGNLTDTTATSTSFTWGSLFYPLPLPQAYIDALSATFLSPSSGTSEIDAVYIDLNITGGGSSARLLLGVG